MGKSTFSFKWRNQIPNSAFFKKEDFHVFSVVYESTHTTKGVITKSIKKIKKKRLKKKNSKSGKRKNDQVYHSLNR